jgi:hypothetical protein
MLILMPIAFVIGALDAILPPIIVLPFWAIGVGIFVLFLKGEVKTLINYPLD